MRARKLPRGIYRRGDVLWIRFKDAERKLSRESTGQADVKVAEAILAKRRSEVAMLHHFPTRKFEQVSFDELLKAWEPAHVRKTPTFHYLLPRVRGGEPSSSGSSVPRATRAGPVPEHRGVPAAAGGVQGPGAADGDPSAVHDDAPAA